MNKDAAVDCLEIGKRALGAKDYDKALRFFTKSKKLDPDLKEADEYIAKTLKLKAEMPSNNNQTRNTSNNSTSDSNRRQNTSNSTNEMRNENEAQNFPKEELEAIQKIINCKDYYEVLGINKRATKEEIKKAYKRKAIKFHPDRNKCPGSTDAFKIISAAYQCLIDDEKRRLYDQYGTEDLHKIGMQRNVYRRFSRTEEEEFLNLFAQMFGDVQHFRTYYPNTYRQREEREQLFSGAMLLQLLPIILIIIISFLSMIPSTTYTAPFSYERTNQFSIERKTRLGQFSYFVNENFEKDYGNNYYYLRRFEDQVVRYRLQELENKCKKERTQKYYELKRARSLNGDKRAEAIKKAEAFEMPSCRRLSEISASYYYY